MAGTLGRTLQMFGGSGGVSRALSAGEVRERILTSSFLFEDEELDRLLRAGHLGDREQVRKLLDRWREPVGDRDPLSQGLYISARTYLPDCVLGPAERLAAESGVFLRFPYVDPEIVHWLEKLPAAMRIEGGRGKRMHRESLAELVPADVLSRPKRDLGDPVRRWLQAEGREKVTEWLLGSSSWLPSVLDGVRVRSLIEEGGKGRSGAEPLCLLIHLELWARETLLGGGR
jgi:asparagine synthase (glutamine-hydrolysing)